MIDRYIFRLLAQVVDLQFSGFVGWWGHGARVVWNTAAR
jgi:hypothetical protein